MRSLNKKRIELFKSGYANVPDCDYYDYYLTEDGKLIDKAFNVIRITEIKENTIKRVIFNNPATIILWGNGKKTVVKVQEGDKYDKRVGFLMCYLKGIVGNKTLLKEVEKWLSEKE